MKAILDSGNLVLASADALICDLARHLASTRDLGRIGDLNRALFYDQALDRHGLDFGRARTWDLLDYLERLDARISPVRAAGPSRAGRDRPGDPRSLLHIGPCSRTGLDVDVQNYPPPGAPGGGRDRRE